MGNLVFQQFLPPERTAKGAGADQVSACVHSRSNRCERFLEQQTAGQFGDPEGRGVPVYGSRPGRASRTGTGAGQWQRSHDRAGHARNGPRIAMATSGRRPLSQKEPSWPRPGFVPRTIPFEEPIASALPAFLRHSAKRNLCSEQSRCCAAGRRSLGR